MSKSRESFEPFLTDMRVYLNSGQPAIFIETMELADTEDAIKDRLPKVFAGDPTSSQLEVHISQYDAHNKLQGPISDWVKQTTAGMRPGSSPVRGGQILPQLPGPNEPQNMSQLMDTLINHVKAKRDAQGDNCREHDVVVVLIGAPMTQGERWIDIATKVIRYCEIAKRTRHSLVLVSLPHWNLPAEIAGLFHKIRHELPTVRELVEIARSIEPLEPGASEDAHEKYLLAAAESAKGMTRTQAETSFCASLVQAGTFDPKRIWADKAGYINQGAAVKVLNSALNFSNVGGNDGLKTFLRRALVPHPAHLLNIKVRGKGILLFGPPGCGKTLVAQAAGNEVGIPVLQVNPGDLMSKFVGETEKNTRQFFSICRAMAPCCVIIDEVEKVMPKADEGSRGDSGVGARMLGSFLTEMNDQTERVYYIFTANDPSQLHEAFTRAERVDGIFYVALPQAEERVAIWQMYLKEFFGMPSDELLQTVADEAADKIRERALQLEDIGNVNAALDVLKEWRAAGTNKARNRLCDRLSLLYMSCSLQDREAIKAQLEKGQLRLDSIAVQDGNWSPAEICSCCRLARQLDEPLIEASQRVRPVAGNMGDTLEKLQEWAERGALSAVTGKAFKKELLAVHPEEEKPLLRRKVSSRKD